MIRFFPDPKVFIEIGPFQIAWYAVLIVSGALIAYRISLKNVTEAGYDGEDLEDLFMGVMLVGILGARLWYVLFYDIKSYLAEPLKIFAVWEGGLAIQGGLLAGAYYAYRFTKKRNINFWHWADMIVPNVLIAQAIGRWGNFMNQEAYGQIVSESYYRYFPTWFKNQMFIQGQYRQPTFFFESFANIIGWILIVFILKRRSKVKRGDLTFAYLMWYGVVRFFVEGFRTDSLYVLNTNIRIAQVMSLIFIAVGIIGYMGYLRPYMSIEDKPVILFDFDGTIMDTGPSIRKAAKQSLEKYRPDLEITDEMLNAFIGPSLYESFGKYVNDDELEDIVNDYRKINRSLHDEYVRPFPYAIEVLKDLNEEGYVCAIVSSKGREMIELGLSLYDMQQYFDEIVALEDVEFTKPNPEGINIALERLARGRDQAIYVGDTESDMEAGSRAGLFTIAVAFDKTANEDILKRKSNRVVHDLRDIKEILKEDHEWTKNMM